MPRFYIASFNRASDGAVQGIKDILQEHDMLGSKFNADYIIAVGDRTETFDYVLERFRAGKPIIHLWAGERSCWTTEDDVYRTSMSLMSMMQLCVNKTAKDTNDIILTKCGKKPNSYIVGNPYLDDMTTDDSIVPNDMYDLVLYNPISSYSDTASDLVEIIEIKPISPVWIEPNGDKNSEVIPSNLPNQQRDKYLGLLKNCNRFITNSSSAYTEAVFFNKEIVWVGDRNRERESKYADMMIPGCKENIMKIIKEL